MFNINSDSWTFSKATSEEIQELFKSMKPIKPPVMAPSLENRVADLERLCRALQSKIDKLEGKKKKSDDKWKVY